MSIQGPSVGISSAGALLVTALVCGTYLHGLLAAPPARSALIRSLAERRGIEADLETRELGWEQLSAWFRDSIDVDAIIRMADIRR